MAVKNREMFSIPFSTIKSPCNAPSRNAPKFSIPFSTIKSMKTKDVNNTPFIFQFHLVRLKVLLHWLMPFILLFSIPFSTIKSFADSWLSYLESFFNSI